MEAGAEIQSGFLQEGGWHSELSKRIRKECLIWNNNSECCALWNCGRTGQNQDWSQQIFLWKHQCSLVFHSLYERLNILSVLFSDGGTPRSPAIPSAASGVCYLSFLPQAEVRSEEVVTWHSWHNKDFPWGAASAWVSVALLYTQVLRLVSELNWRTSIRHWMSASQKPQAHFSASDSWPALGWSRVFPVLHPQCEVHGIKHSRVWNIIIVWHLTSRIL